MSILEFLRHRLIGTPLDSFARQMRRWHTHWKIRGAPEIRDAMFEDDFLKDICAREIADGMNCVDVGSHLGAMTSLFLTLSPGGRHVAVEPTPYKAAWLRRRYTKVKVVEAALAEEPGQATFFHQERNSGYSGLSKHDAGINDAKHVQEMRVEVKRLDDVVPDTLPVHFLKVDVEGAELRVFRGGSRVLTRDRPVIIFECTCTGLPANQFTSQMVYDHLHDLRYTIRTPRGYLERQPAMSATELEAAIRYPFRAFSFIARPVERGEPTF
jgi:FkbM family methyltransferase